MLDTTKYTRTTITIPEELLWAIKKKAWEERRDFKEVVTEGLAVYLTIDSKNAILKGRKKIDINSLFGLWGRGKDGLSFVNDIRYGESEKKKESAVESLLTLARKAGKSGLTDVAKRHDYYLYGKPKHFR